MSRAALVLAVLVLTLPACGGRRLSGPPAAPAPSAVPRTDVTTSTRSVTSLLARPDGTLWVGTTGGLLRCAPDGTWRKWTRRDGLPSEEVQRLAGDGEAVRAVFPQAARRWAGGGWQPAPVPPAEASPSAARTCAPAVWQGQTYVATLTGLEIGAGADARTVPLPPSPGTHVSALLPHGEALWAALYGDGLWAWDGRGWHPLPPAPPAGAREITALAVQGDRVWIGTRRAGVWVSAGRGWSASSPAGDEPADHNVQSLAFYRDALYATTLEDGLQVRGAGGWRQVTAPTLSSPSPRQMVVLGGRLYVRHGDGRVDRFDGTRWARDVFAFLPRGRVSALASDGTRLFLAQWGGWSEFDGRTWTHHLTLPALRGLVLTSLSPQGGTLWIGTQGRGLAQVDRATGAVRWHDERDGLPDDWVTCLAHAGPHVYAGTFVGGLAVWDGVRWTVPHELRGQNVTALASDGAGGVWIATRHGGWHAEGGGRLTPLAARAPFLEPEQQALCPVPGGIWIGARTGLDFLRDTPQTVWK